MINAIADTFEVLPLGMAVFGKSTSLYVMDVASSIFVTAVKIAAPIAVVIFLMNLAFGLIARAIPQINILIVSFTVNILVGLFTLFLVMPQLGGNIELVFQSMISHMTGVLVHLDG